MSNSLHDSGVFDDPLVRTRLQSTLSAGCIFLQRQTRSLNAHFALKVLCKRVLSFCSSVTLLGLSAAHAQSILGTLATNPANSTQSTLVSNAVPLDGAVKMIPYRDPWLPARERWRDIADNPLHAFQTGTQSFSYHENNSSAKAPQVTLSYSTSPPVPYFIGRIDARGLKPNFAYQLKLVGKPTKGRRGWGVYGSAFANESLGYAGRWWCGHPIHASGTNFDDAHFLNEYKNALPGMEHNMYGYIYMGQFITDSAGEAHTMFYGDYPYHISWASWQGGAKDVLHGRFPVRSAVVGDITVGNAPGAGWAKVYGYGSPPPSSSVTLYYENEPGRTQPLTLPAGVYRCQFLITEESFHNPVTNSPEGGYWKTVLASEDFAYDEKGNLIGYDTDASNDIVFSIGSQPSVRAMKAQLTLSIAQPKRQEYKATARVVVTDNLGRRIRGATVSGYWAGLHRTAEITANTNSTGIDGLSRHSDGIAHFETPNVRGKRGQCFRFVVTNIAKTGRTWERTQRPSIQVCL